MKQIVRKNFYVFMRKSWPNKRVAKLHLKKTYTNIFITLTDLWDKVIVCLSAGLCEKSSDSKRRKTSPQAIEVIMESMNKYFLVYEITDVIIDLKMKSNVFFRFLIKELRYYNIKILRVDVKRKLPFVPMRGRKLRRK